MSRRERFPGTEPNLPERLREGGGSELERRVLNAAAGELPSRELCERMALGIGISAPPTAPLPATAPDLGAAMPQAAAGLRGLLPWLSAGVVVVVAGAFVAPRPSAPTPLAKPAPRAAVSVPSPPFAPAATVPDGPAAAIESAPSRVTAPAPRARPSGAVADIQDQIALVDAARAALSAGAGARALELLRQYQSKYPTGSFRPEAQALRIEALAKLGRAAEARALAQRFIEEHRGSPLADRVSRVTGDSPRQ